MLMPNHASRFRASLDEKITLWTLFLLAVCFLPADEMVAQSTVIPAEAPEHAVQVEATESKFLRVVKDTAGNPQSLQTSIARYRPTEGDLIVDLIGAVHIGEGNYYEMLNRQFKLYDVVLYELVAPEGTRIPAGGKKEASGTPLDMISWLQQQMQETLGLESQLENVDYQQPNLIHADLSPSAMGQKMAERGDTVLTVGLSAIAEMMRQQNRLAKAAQKSGDAAAIANLTPADMMDMLGEPLKLKPLMASQFVVSGVMDTGLGETLNQLLIADRNEAAMKVLQKQIASGKKKIGIFYGAAHMADFEQRLANELGLRPDRHVWLDAWDLTKSGKSPIEGGASSLMMQLIREMTR